MVAAVALGSYCAMVAVAAADDLVTGLEEALTLWRKQRRRGIICAQAEKICRQ